MAKLRRYDWLCWIDDHKDDTKEIIKASSASVAASIYAQKHGVSRHCVNVTAKDKA